MAGIVLLRTLGAVLPNVSGATATDVIVTALLTIIVGVSASYWPAHVAARVDPLPVLKSE